MQIDLPQPGLPTPRHLTSSSISPTRFLLMPYRNLVTIFLTAIVSFACYRTAQKNRYASTIGSAMTIIEEQALQPSTRRDLFYAAMDGMMNSLDEHSAFIDPDRLPELEEHLDQEFGGVGFIVETHPETQALTIVCPLMNTPAFRAGISAGDVITAIDGQSSEGMNSSDAVNKIKGPRGTQVTLTLQSSETGELRDVDLVRELISVESVVGDRRRPDGSWEYTLEDHPEIAYVRIKEFGEKTATELEAVAETLPENILGLILDLRYNSGGLLDRAVEVCDLFLNEGTIVTIKSRGGEPDRPPYTAELGTAFPDKLPVAILINSGTASASEIVAACLQDHECATVVGERSYGKGTVQQIIKIDGGRSALKLTVSSYWRPSGRNIHRLNGEESDEWGVLPDPGYEVPLTDEQARRQFLWQRQREYPATVLSDEIVERLLQRERESSAVVSSAEDSPADPNPDQESDPDPQLRKAIEAVVASSDVNVALQ
ncbi:MAG: S41 family peptidase [Planctomycetota bacterium]|nr:S41 family peptidase [Planctomycetota bacterium]